MSKSHPTPWAQYNFESEKYSKQYNQLIFSNIHRQFIKFLPPPESKILDIGCGSGRDAYSLARRGYIVTAVDPSIKMLQQAKKYNDHKNINWLNERLPSLEKIKNQKFDFILLSAVWMHISPHKRKKSINTMSQLLNDDGCIALTLRIALPDPTRAIYAVTLEELLKLAKENSLLPIYISRKAKDSFKRSEITWIKVVLKKSQA
ncbi:hypothetical protein BVH03_14175 [Pseudomonas sp. PA15(2017)]|uniref:class I SAM-dependent methyltransferase n=1 Tax=Pseudomonas sp. PA15(2017) TaxID=1932111 RepID=UPI00095AEED8|nr:class I SAM-dependent methyltransferase [Pseudomonas sp. PA15(2017)]OLU27364.1 hypothetical protein BVH03_14175 [Pseudomonas sp. PA15(2017)]